MADQKSGGIFRTVVGILTVLAGVYLAFLAVKSVTTSALVSIDEWFLVLSFGAALFLFGGSLFSRRVARVKDFLFHGL